MEIFPAIDIKDGAVVRLTQGDYAQVAVYAADPAKIAGQFRKKGARNLHIVDLDGARDGQIVNDAAVRRIVEQGGLFTQLGGGIRDEARIVQYLDLGINRVILGTIAAENRSFVAQMAAAYPDRIAVAVDARNGKVAVNGWREVTDIDSLGFCKELEQIGVKTIIYTDIARDGMGQGTNLAVYETLAQLLSCRIIASGGITHLEEFSALRKIGIHGAIVGKALYTGALSLEEVLAC